MSWTFSWRLSSSGAPEGSRHEGVGGGRPAYGGNGLSCGAERQHARAQRFSVV